MEDQTNETESPEDHEKTEPRSAMESLAALAQRDPKEEMRARAELCDMAIRKALEEYGCRIAPYLAEPEWVGAQQSKMMVSALYGIVPLPRT